MSEPLSFRPVLVTDYKMTKEIRLGRGDCDGQYEVSFLNGNDITTIPVRATLYVPKGGIEETLSLPTKETLTETLRFCAKELARPASDPSKFPRPVLDYVINTPTAKFPDIVMHSQQQVMTDIIDWQKGETTPHGQKLNRIKIGEHEVTHHYFTPAATKDILQFIQNNLAQLVF